MGENKKEKEFLCAYDQYADAIYRHCYFRVYDKELAEDLTQETFVKTWKYIIAGQEIKNIKAFLYRVAVNLIIDHSRRKKTVSLEEFAGNIGAKDEQGFVRLNNMGGKSMEDEIFKNIEFKKLVKMFDKLSDSQRQVMIMRYVDQMSPSEISDILGQTANAISVKINQATGKLRQFINERHI